MADGPYTDAQLSDGRTLRFQGQLGPDEVRQKVHAFRTKEGSAQIQANPPSVPNPSPAGTLPPSDSRMSTGSPGLVNGPADVPAMPSKVPQSIIHAPDWTGEAISGLTAVGAAAPVAGPAMSAVGRHPILSMMALEAAKNTPGISGVARHIPMWLPLLATGKPSGAAAAEAEATVAAPEAEAAGAEGAFPNPQLRDAWKASGRGTADAPIVRQAGGKMAVKPPVAAPAAPPEPSPSIPPTPEPQAAPGPSVAPPEPFQRETPREYPRKPYAWESQPVKSKGGRAEALDDQGVKQDLEQGLQREGDLADKQAKQEFAASMTVGKPKSAMAQQAKVASPGPPKGTVVPQTPEEMIDAGNNSLEDLKKKRKK